MRPRLDENEVMLLQSLIIAVAFWGVMLALAFLSGCTQHNVDVSSSSVDRVVDRIATLDTPVKCRPLNLPPVPDRVTLQIDGDKIAADEGGELLLRGYVACRGAPTSTKQTARP